MIQNLLFWSFPSSLPLTTKYRYKIRNSSIGALLSLLLPITWFIYKFSFIKVFIISAVYLFWFNFTNCHFGKCGCQFIESRTNFRNCYCSLEIHMAVCNEKNMQEGPSTVLKYKSSHLEVFCKIVKNRLIQLKFSPQA